MRELSMGHRQCMWVYVCKEECVDHTCHHTCCMALSATTNKNSPDCIRLWVDLCCLKPQCNLLENTELIGLLVWHTDSALLTIYVQTDAHGLNYILYLAMSGTAVLQTCMKIPYDLLLQDLKMFYERWGHKFRRKSDGFLDSSQKTFFFFNIASYYVKEGSRLSGYALSGRESLCFR